MPNQPGPENDPRELERLRAWKREAMTLFDGMQDLGRALNIPLGVLVTGPLAIEAADRLRAERDAALAALAERDIPPHWRCSECGWHTMVGDECGWCGAEVGREDDGDPDA